MSASIAIGVDGVSKKYRLYHERNQTLKSAVMRGRRAQYEEFWALRDVSFEIAKGETFGLVGENGSGKSTLLKCIAHILRPDAGRIDVDGKVSALLELGAGFHLELSGRENVYLNGAILGLSKKQITSRFDEIVDFAGLEQFIDSPVKTYSSGMYLRLGFSVAINVDPDILLVDEILAVGDAEFQRKSAEKFSELRENGKTIVIVSHGLDAIRNFCDRAVLLNHGHMLALGPASEVVDAYLDGVHLDRSAGAVGARYGSGEISIEKVELLDASGEATTSPRTGEPITLRMHFVTTEPVERPVFGIAITPMPGVAFTGPNTRDVELIPEKLDGRGYVDFHVEQFMLLPHTYDITTTVFDDTMTHPYDVIAHALRFDVVRGTPVERFGFVSLGGTWDIVETEES